MELMIPACGYLTNDAFAVHAASQRIQQFNKDTKKVIIVLSDGSPNPTGSRISSEDSKFLVSKKVLQQKPTYSSFDLEHEVAEADNKAIVVGLGIQDRSVEKYYTFHEYVERTSDIPRAVTAQLKRYIRRG